MLRILPRSVRHETAQHSLSEEKLQEISTIREEMRDPRRRVFRHRVLTSEIIVLAALGGTYLGIVINNANQLNAQTSKEQAAVINALSKALTRKDNVVLAEASGVVGPAIPIPLDPASAIATRVVDAVLSNPNQYYFFTHTFAHGELGLSINQYNESLPGKIKYLSTGLSAMLLSVVVGSVAGFNTSASNRKDKEALAELKRREATFYKAPLALHDIVSK